MTRCLSFLLFFLSIVAIKAQTSVSFYNLGSTTFQNSYLNPALVPQGKVFIGLPGISGVHLHFNNKVSYNQAITKQENSTLIDITKIISNLQRQNMLSAHVNVNLLHFGYRLNSGTVLSLTANERVEGDLLYPKQLVQYIWDPTASFVNENVEIGRAGVKLTHFREFGIGATVPVNEFLTVGARAKYLVGFLDVSAPGTFVGTINSNGEGFQVDADFQNASFRTSGRGIYNGDVGNLGSHLLFNANRGAALDVGIKYRLTPRYTVTASVLDLGFINWNEDIENRSLTDTTFNYEGVNLNTSISNVREVLEDSLINRLSPSTNNDPYRGWMPARAYASLIWRYRARTDIHSTVGARMIQQRMKMLYGVGVTHRFGKAFTGSVTATKLPQQFFNAGAALAVRGGPVQFYMAADQIINFSVPDAKAFDFRLGINLIFDGRDGGNDDEVFGRKLGKAKGLDTNAFMGKRVKTKKREGIYSIIPKQRKRELSRTTTKRNQKVRRKSLTGRSGRSNEL